MPSPSPRRRDPRPAPQRSLSVWMAGRIGWEAYLRMAEQLAWEVSEPDGRPPTLVLGELAASITVGRLGSRSDVEFTDEELAARSLAVRFVGRGGGAVVHLPGQVFAALFVALPDVGLARHAVGPFVERFETGLEGAIRSLRCGTARDSRAAGVFGRSGLLAAVGIAIRRGVSWHGAFLNVSPALETVRRVRTVPGRGAGGGAMMGSVEADLGRRVRLPDARAALVEQIADAFAFGAPHVHAGFPLPVRDAEPQQESSRSVG